FSPFIGSGRESELFSNWFDQRPGGGGVLVARMVRRLCQQWMLLLIVLSVAPAGAAQTLKRIASFDLPGPPGKRFDYLTIDYKHHYLLSAHLGAGNLYVIDLKTNRVVKTIPDVPGIEGVEYAPDVNKVYTSDWLESKIGVVSMDTMTVIKKLP